MAFTITRRLLCKRVTNIYEHFNVATNTCVSTLLYPPTPKKIVHYENHKIQFVYPVSPIYFKCFSTSSKCNKDIEHAEVKKPTLFQKFKQMYRDYWYVLVPVHIVTSAVWFGSFYYMAKR